MKKQVGYIGLGKMGSAMVDRLEEKGWNVVSYDISGHGTAKSLEELAANLQGPRVVWIMVPSGKPVDDVLEGLVPHLAKGDIVIDGGNSFYEGSVRRAGALAAKGISFLDIGVSGGPQSVAEGKPALMAGGGKKAFETVLPLLQDISQTESIGYMGEAGAGHFVKMVHNGIEYGMMQALAEGFALMKESPFGIDLQEAARIYSNGSVIESRLTKWLEAGFAKYGQELDDVSPTVGHTGEGEWAVKTAEKLGLSVPVIEQSFAFRVESEKKPSYAGKILMLLRHMFGGHSIK